jgi:hypothetical protein
VLKSLICPFFIFCICAPASASEDVAIGDWLTTIDNDTCWMAAHPFSQPSSEAGHKFHQDIYFNVAFQNGSPQPEFSIVTDKIDKHNEEVLVSLGSETYEFPVIVETAVSKSMNDRDILFQMLKSDTPTFVLKVKETESLSLLYVPLEGFEDAYNYISKKCNFRNNPGFFRKLSSMHEQPYGQLFKAKQIH